jgi:hypothetical protein
MSKSYFLWRQNLTRIRIQNRMDSDWSGSLDPDLLQIRTDTNADPKHCQNRRPNNNQQAVTILQKMVGIIVET